MAVFAPKPQMRAFGRGIRRRLAPMLADPRQRKLAISLLCALPGAPVLLYGDEIGMGDALDLPDRAGQGGMNEQQHDYESSKELPAEAGAGADVDPVSDEVGDRPSGQLVAPDEGVAEDAEKDLVAEDVGHDETGPSAEEAAVHEIPEEPGS